MTTKGTAESKAALGPIPHYPNWQYWCPEHEGPYEIDVRWTEDYVTACPDCIRKRRAGGK